MVAAGRGRMLNPDLVLLDEPWMGLAPILVQEVFRIIERLRSEGVTMLLVEQFAAAALKVARKFGHDKGIDKPEIVVYEAAFHGRSIATLSATGNPKIRAGFGPLGEGFVRVPLNDGAAIANVARTRPHVVAV